MLRKRSCPVEGGRHIQVAATVDRKSRRRRASEIDANGAKKTKRVDPTKWNQLGGNGGALHSKEILLKPEPRVAYRTHMDKFSSLSYYR